MLCCFMFVLNLPLSNSSGWSSWFYLTMSMFALITHMVIKTKSITYSFSQSLHIQTEFKLLNLFSHRIFFFKPKALHFGLTIPSEPWMGIKLQAKLWVHAQVFLCGKGKTDSQRSLSFQKGCGPSHLITWLFLEASLVHFSWDAVARMAYNLLDEDMSIF